jgi:hypothetical protein
MRTFSEPGAARSLALAAGIFLLYVVSGKIGLSLALSSAVATAVWPPTGIAIAALLG